MKNKMLKKRTTDNITVYFIDTMIPHHKAAIEMCQNLLKFTNYNPLINIANNIIKMQTIGINQMTKIRKTTKNFSNDKQKIYNYSKNYLAITNNMIYKMQNSKLSSNINLDFINEMIPHHEGAILMCQNLLQYKIDLRLRQVATSIIKNQTKGVTELKKIRDNLV